MAYSIDLYAINLKNMGVPEQITQISAVNSMVRQAMRERLALSSFDCYSNAGLIKINTVSPRTVKQICDAGPSYLIEVMP
jgi:hypothetical protein